MTGPLRAATRDYRFIDYATQLYVGVVGLLILLFHGSSVPSWPLLVAAHAACMVLIHALIRAHARRPGGGLLGLLRHFYPILLYTAFYRETGLLNHIFVAGYADRFFIDLDQRLFGFQPSVVFMEWLPHLAVSELFYASYFSYYLMILGIGIILYFRGREHFFHYVSSCSFVFYLCYLTYILLPVVGARAFWAAVPDFSGQSELAFYPLSFPAEVQAGVFFHVMRFIYEHFEAHGAAFPSSHVAVALCTVWFSWRYVPRIRYGHLVVVILLCLSTVYCRYHYAVDVLAGILTAAVLVPLADRLHRWFP